MLRALVPLAVLAALVGFFWVGLSLDPTEIPSPLIDEPAPNFERPTLHDPDASTSLAQFRGRIVLVNVWGSWCVGCHQEHEMLMRIAEQDRIPVYGINLRDERDNALRFLERLGDPYVVSAYDRDGTVAIDWGVYGAPETFLVDASGMIRYKHIGPITDAVWTEEILPRIRRLEEGRG